MMDRNLVAEFLAEFLEEEITDINIALSIWGVHGVLKSFESWLKRKEIIPLDKEVKGNL